MSAFISAPGPLELIVILVVALIVLGPKKLPEAARSVGRGMREFKESIQSSTDYSDYEDDDYDDLPAEDLPAEDLPAEDDPPSAPDEGRPTAKPVP